MFKESFDCPWGLGKLSDEYIRMSLDEKIEYLRRRTFGDNPDKNSPAFKLFDTGIKKLRESLKKETKEDS